MKFLWRTALNMVCNFLAQGLTHGMASSMGIFYREWKKDFQEQSALISWLATSALAMLLGTSPLAGAVTRHFGVRTAMLLGGVLSVAGLLAASFAESIHVLFVTIPFLTGIGCSLAFSGCIVSVAQNFSKHYTLVNGVVSSGCGIGMVVWPVIFQLLVDALTWRGALQMIAAIQLHILPIALLLTRHQSAAQRPKTKLTVVEDGPQDRDGSDADEDFRCEEQETMLTYEYAEIKQSGTCGRTGNGSEVDQFIVNGNDGVYHEQVDRHCVNTDKDVWKGGVSSSHDSSRGTDIFMQRVIRRSTIIWKNVKTSSIRSTGISLLWENRVFASYIIITFTGGSMFGVFLGHAPSVAILSGVLPLEAAFLISVVGIANTVVRATHGLLLKTGWVHQMFLLALSYYVAVVGLLILPSTQSYAVMVVCAACVGAGSGVYIPLQLANTRHMVSLERFPGGAGMVLLSVCLSIMMNSSVTGYIFDQTNNYQAALGCAGAVGLLAGTLVIINHIVWTSCIIDDRWPPKVNTEEKKKQDTEVKTEDKQG